MDIWRYDEPVGILGNRYTLEKRLGAGGMAEVFLARDEQLQRKVAIKLLKDEEADTRMQNRFIKEAGQTVGWQHPHILRVYGHVRTHQLAPDKPSLFYIVMEYASGGNLQQRLIPGEPYHSLADAFTLFRQMCGAVQYAHTHRVIHRDIKPLNILFRQPRTGPEEAVLADFGLAVQLDASHHTFEHAGTLAYMAPEQLRNQAVLASDIFALGVTLYLLCTGYLPFQRELKNLNAVLTGIEPQPLPPGQLNPALPSELDGPLLQALQADPSARYRSAESFWDAIVAALARAQLASEPWLASIPSSTPSLPDAQRARPVLGNPTETMAGETSTEPGAASGQQQTFSTLVRRASRTRAPLSSLDLPASLSRVPPRRSATPPLGLDQRSSATPASAAESYSSTTPRLASGRRSETPSIPASDRLPVISRPSHPAGKQSALSRRRLPRFVLPLTGGVSGLLLLVLLLAHVLPLFAQNASVAIIPRAQVEQKTTALSVDQVQSHQLSATFSQSATSPATGTIPATSARGNLLFQNDTPNPITLQSMTFTSKSGIAISFNGPVIIPPPYKAIPAFAVQAGAAGNIPQLDIAQAALQDAQGNTQLFVKNVTAFVGGTDALPRDQVQQSDIDQAANPLIATQKQQAQTRLAAQVQSNEQPIAETRHCSPTVTPSVLVGAQAHSVTVNVTVICTEEVYDQASARLQATSLLSAQAPTGYRLAGQVAVSELGMSGTSAVQIHAQGQWFYYFSTSQLKGFAHLIEEKSQEQARILLLQQTGVADALISGPATLPSADRIQIQLQ